ncbi:hypothetical protein OIV83_006426 [Microbotryomycetes sp. JL201]|nr:hypothetical protein OIV83_006426 [Microbotryomycetes sp. JL201]
MPERKGLGGSKGKKKVDKSGLGRAIINRKARDARIRADPTLHTSEIAAGLRSVTQENDLDEFLSTAQLADTDFKAERQNIKVVSDPSLASSKSGQPSFNPYLLSPAEELELRQKQRTHAQKLQVPRRPHWTRDMTTVELERRERDSFLEWRRGLADLQDNQSILLTPFERNLEVWRQLWRTCERSDLVVQIVDARNPLAFRSRDLENYVLELNDKLDDQESQDTDLHATENDTKDENKTDVAKKDQYKVNKARKRNLLLINNEQWADYFEQQNIQYAFFSAANGIALQEERARREELARLQAEAETDDDDDDDDDDEYTDEDGIVDEEHGIVPGMKIPKSGNKLVSTVGGKGKQRRADDFFDSDDEDDDSDVDGTLARRFKRGLGMSEPGSDEPNRTRILSVLELEDLFLQHAPDPELVHHRSGEKLVVGLVGYPNVGKSSTINALIGEKKVSVSSTPGKTKHFQTIRLSPDVLLCDCPGLVFPQFAATQADLVCDGVLPIDQLREFTGPVSLITLRIPQDVLEGTYGLRIKTQPVSEGGSGTPTAAEFLSTYAIGRGFFTGGQGNPDLSRAARYILKDYVRGKLLYCVPPPDVSADDFNAENRDVERLRQLGRIKQKMAPTTRVTQKSDTFVQPGDIQSDAVDTAGAMSRTGGPQSGRAKALDKKFFAKQASGMPSVNGVAGEKLGSTGFSRVRMFPHQQNVINDKGELVPQQRKLTNKQKKAAAALEQGLDPDDKRHFKPRRQKQRSGAGYDD